MAVGGTSSSTGTFVCTGDVKAGTRPTRRAAGVALQYTVPSNQYQSRPIDHSELEEPSAHLDLPDTAGIARLAQSGFTTVHGGDVDVPILQDMIRQKRT